jgi:hypothetical protein
MVASSGRIDIDVKRLPLIDLGYHGEMTIPIYRGQLERIATICKSERAIILRLDMRDFNPLGVDAASRKAAVAVWQENRDLFLETIAAEARVVESALTRGVLTAFDWLTSEKGKWPCRQFAAMDTAETWLWEELAAWKAKPPQGARP